MGALSVDIKKLKIIKSFKIEKKYFFPKEFQNKEISLAYEVSDDVVNDWKKKSFSKSIYLLRYLTERFNGIDNFDLILFNEENGPRFLIEGNKVYLNYPPFLKFCSEVERRERKFKISEYYWDFNKEIFNKATYHYFSNLTSDDLFKEIEKTVFEVIEKMLREFDKLEPSEKKSLRKTIEHSSLGTELLDKYKRLGSLAPEKTLKSTIKNIDKLNEKGVLELLEKIFRSKKRLKYFKEFGKLPLDIQTKLLKNCNKAARFVYLYDELKESLSKFEKKIKEHKKSEKKDEKDIHAFLADNYWLLGIEYFGQVIDTSVNEFGKKVNETKFLKGRVIPDFTINKIDGLVDECVVIELEEANDRIFNKDGTLSTKVFDGINQAKLYTILKRLEENEEAKGIAVIGSTGKLNKKQAEKLKRLSNSFLNVEILTYEDIIKNAKKVIKFLEKYKKKSEI